MLLQLETRDLQTGGKWSDERLAVFTKPAKLDKSETELWLQEYKKAEDAESLDLQSKLTLGSGEESKPKRGKKVAAQSIIAEPLHYAPQREVALTVPNLQVPPPFWRDQEDRQSGLSNGVESSKTFCLLPV